MSAVTAKSSQRNNLLPQNYRMKNENEKYFIYPRREIQHCSKIQIQHSTKNLLNVEFEFQKFKFNIQQDLLQVPFLKGCSTQGGTNIVKLLLLFKLFKGLCKEDKRCLLLLYFC